MKSDIAYIEQKSFWYDCQLAARTFGFLLRLIMSEIKQSLTIHVI